MSSSSELEKIKEELSFNEVKVILTLSEMEYGTPEQLVVKGGFRQLVEVMNSIAEKTLLTPENSQHV